MAHSNILKFADKKGNEYAYLFIDTITGIFYAKKRVGMNILVGSLETTDFNTARSKVMDKISEMTKEAEKSGPQRSLIFKDFYELMMDEKVTNETAPITMKRVEGIWRLSLEPFWAYIQPGDINQQMVTEFITWHRRHRPGVQLINIFKYLGNVLNTMVDAGAMLAPNKPRLDLPKEEVKHHAKQKGRYITDDEVHSILKHSDKQTWLLVMIAYCTGMRKMEIGSLSLERLEKQSGRYVIKLDTDDTKTGLAREVPLPISLNVAVEAQINKKSDFLFPMKTDLKRHTSSQLIDKGWVEAKTAAKIKGQMRFHDLRHTCASNFAKANINPVIAVTILGMSFTTFQKTYLKLKASDLIIASETNSDRILGVVK